MSANELTNIAKCMALWSKVQIFTEIKNEWYHEKMILKKLIFVADALRNQESHTQAHWTLCTFRLNSLSIVSVSLGVDNLFSTCAEHIGQRYQGKVLLFQV